MSIVQAGMGATRPAELMAAPALAAVWLMLFSPMPNGRTRKALDAAAQNPKAMRAAVMDMFMPQPIFRPR